MPNRKQLDNFNTEIKGLVELPSDILETVLDWILRNLEVDDVFPEKEIFDYAEANGYEKK